LAGGAQRPFGVFISPKKTGARSARARTRGHLSYIYLGYFVCLCVIVCVCVSQFVSERSAILLVLVIKLTKVTRRRAWRGRDRDGEIGKGQIREGGYEWTFYCLSQTWETCRFTVSPAVALLNYISSGKLWRIFSQTGIFAGFSLNTVLLILPFIYVPLLSVCFICMFVIQQTGRI
jgi:hypothetical protein